MLHVFKLLGILYQQLCNLQFLGLQFNPPLKNFSHHTFVALVEVKLVISHISQIFDACIFFEKINK